METGYQGYRHHIVLNVFRQSVRSAIFLGEHGVRFPAVDYRLRRRVEFQYGPGAVCDLAEVNERARPMSNVSIRFACFA